MIEHTANFFFLRVFRLRNLLADAEYTLPKEIQSQSPEIDFKVNTIKTAFAHL